MNNCSLGLIAAIRSNDQCESLICIGFQLNGKLRTIDLDDGTTCQTTEEY